MKFEKTIYLDVDNTLLASEKRLTELWNKYYREDNEPEKDWTEIVTWDCNIPSDVVGAIFSRHDFYDIDLAPLYPDVVSSLKHLKNKGYKIVIYTKGTFGNTISKANYLETLLDDVIDGHIFVGGRNFKMGKSSYDMKDCIIIDDHIDNLVGNNTAYNICAKLSNNIVGWNKDFKEDINKGNLVMNNWKELPKIIEMIEMIS